jgi:hypothetical protein
MDVAVAGLEKRTSIALGDQTLAHHPMLQHAVALVHEIVGKTALGGLGEPQRW